MKSVSQTQINFEKSEYNKIVETCDKIQIASSKKRKKIIYSYNSKINIIIIQYTFVSYIL